MSPRTRIPRSLIRLELRRQDAGEDCDECGAAAMWRLDTTALTGGRLIPFLTYACEQHALEFLTAIGDPIGAQDA